jgi:hypothetical protein
MQAPPERNVAPVDWSIDLNIAQAVESSSFSLLPATPQPKG